jgi:hypothetical protein
MGEKDDPNLDWLPFMNTTGSCRRWRQKFFVGDLKKKT